MKNALAHSNRWLLTRSGGQFYFENPDPGVILIEDIGHALALQCRYVGHVNRFYSVAEHSCRVSDLVAIAYGRDRALEGLLHDAAEAYLGDVSRNLKALLPQYKKIEEIVTKVIAEKFSVPAEKSAEVDWADKVLYRTERRDLFAEGLPVHPESSELAPLREIITPLSWERAEIEFMVKYRRLVYERERQTSRG